MAQRAILFCSWLWVGFGNSLAGHSPLLHKASAKVMPEVGGAASKTSGRWEITQGYWPEAWFFSGGPLPRVTWASWQSGNWVPRGLNTSWKAFFNTACVPECHFYCILLVIHVTKKQHRFKGRRIKLYLSLGRVVKKSMVILHLRHILSV